MFNPVEEICFWSGIMRDHAEIQLTALSSRETEAINNALFFKNAFAALETEARRLMAAPNAAGTAGIVNRSAGLVLSFINFKRLLLQRLLECGIELGLTPTFVNHMINEAMEFYRTLCMMQSKLPIDTTKETIHLHKIWLADASGHAASIAADLDPVESILIKEAEEFKKAFDSLLIKTAELGPMLERACLDDGALEFLNEEVRKSVTSFICYLGKIYKLREQCKALGIIKPLVPDHMIREEKYYLSKIPC